MLIPLSRLVNSVTNALAEWDLRTIFRTHAIKTKTLLSFFVDVSLILEISMCGIFGFTLQQNAPVEAAQMRSLIRRLVSLSESRGKEAAGLALRTSSALHVYKEASRGTAFVKTETFGKVTALLSGDMPLAMIGHTRLVTNGSMEQHENNQPVVRDGIIGIHNGIIVNDAELFASHNLERQCEVDTEALLACLASLRAAGQSLPAAVCDVYRELHGTASVALLFRDTPALLLATNNGSLYTLTCSHGIIFASERHILEEVVRDYGSIFECTAENIAHIRAGNAQLIRLSDGAHLSFAFTDVSSVVDIPVARQDVPLIDWPSERSAPRKTVRNNFDDDALRSYEDIHSMNAISISRLRRCIRCILPETMPFISFDEKGVCIYCRNHVPHQLLGTEALERAVAPLRGNGLQSDCLFPLSGGRDSSYGLHYVKEVLGLNPIAYSYDWGMLTDLGRRNQARMCGALGVEHLLISADIEKKRRYIQQNVHAWLRHPNLGTVPLFMAGDKQYFYYLNKLQGQTHTSLSVYCENPLEQTNFKYGFCGVAPKFDSEHVYRIGLMKKLRLALYYAKHSIQNTRLLNTSAVDTAGAFLATYFLPHDYIYLFRYIPWEEEVINSTLRDQYDWELADDTPTSWRIGDGTAAFYNYIYYTVAGFTENDTFRSNQIREGLLTRDRALELVSTENAPRFPSLQWYGNTIGIDMHHALDVINTMPKRYAVS